MRVPAGVAAAATGGLFGDSAATGASPSSAPRGGRVAGAPPGRSAVPGTAGTHEARHQAGHAGRADLRGAGAAKTAALPRIVTGLRFQAADPAGVHIGQLRDGILQGTHSHRGCRLPVQDAGPSAARIQPRSGCRRFQVAGPGGCASPRSYRAGMPAGLVTAVAVRLDPAPPSAAASGVLDDELHVLDADGALASRRQQLPRPGAVARPPGNPAARRPARPSSSSSGTWSVDRTCTSADRKGVSPQRSAESPCPPQRAPELMMCGRALPGITHAG